MKIKTLTKIIAGFVATSMFCLNVPSSLNLNISALADNEDGAENQVTSNQEEAGDSKYPYTKTFTISAYYSPLPCQNRYATGSYEADIRLNGRGVRGADGTPVFLGMVAAPSSYQFGTKMTIPGIGVVAVHDRGGAIVQAGARSGVNLDRLDIWMGYGDKGLARALKWGKRNIDVTVHGKDETIEEIVTLDDFTPEEAIPNCSTNEQPAIKPNLAKSDEIKSNDPEKNLAQENTKNMLHYRDLKLGDVGDDVRRLQSELKNLNLYRGPITGNYGQLTEHAVFKFQQIKGLANNKNLSWAGEFGPKTRESMNEVVKGREYVKLRIASATLKKGVQLANKDNDDVLKKEVAISSHLSPGTSGEEVKELQRFLKEQGVFAGEVLTGYFGEATKQAVIAFQLENKIIGSEQDVGAGRVGPNTLKKIQELSD